MDLRAQAHDIIRTWLFYSVIRSLQLDGEVPWKAAAISGFVTDPDRKKMSKSVGNVVTPTAPLDEFGVDAVRYWAAGGRPGTDTVFDPNRMRVGRRLALKILNASRFVLGFDAPDTTVTEPLDLAMLAALDAVIGEATAALAALDHTRALAVVEAFFWTFCDDYIELVKGRAYDGSGSAVAALRLALDTLLRLFAPVLPYATEEVWSWWRDGSVHRASWPVAGGLGGEVGLFGAASELIGALRRAKAADGWSMRTEVDKLTLPADTPGLSRLPLLRADLRSAAHATEIVAA
jgi:valyl-tRNA synthetase